MLGCVAWARGHKSLLAGARAKCPCQLQAPRALGHECADQPSAYAGTMLCKDAGKMTKGLAWQGMCGSGLQARLQSVRQGAMHTPGPSNVCMAACMEAGRTLFLGL